MLNFATAGVGGGDRGVGPAVASDPAAEGRLAAALADRMGHSGAIATLAEALEAVVGTDYSVLLLGETGAGKELAARALHDCGPRRAKPFVAVDCGALPDSLIEDVFVRRPLLWTPYAWSVDTAALGGA